ncbi:MAG: ribosome biogenesis GTP-binding protein YihA/YsxC [Proteobacteria bacterium]|nr:ribosome biogenesis GTP-binding protein YihA/YsxC [Pseudomonadota bacterium]
MDSRYITAFQNSQQLRDLGYPEIAFVGRSNVGKSSLLNALLQRKNLAKTSKTPGRTQMIHMFLWNNSILLADLPGYGYQKTPHSISKHWQPLMSAYFQRKELKGTLILLDARRDLYDHEITFITSLRKDIQPLLILTKSDKLNTSKLQAKVQHTKNILQQSQLSHIPILTSSVLKKTHLDKIRQALQHMATHYTDDPL